tara:strand:- start:1943 stop:2281 length:339 start_codon:yes stop_codon:yes gene_type:complete
MTEELERLARAATEGPWSVDERLEPECVRGRYDDIVVMETERLSDAAFIAAANPATILDLLAANRKMRTALEPFAGLELPRRRGGNAGFYLIRFADVERARSALSTKEQPNV